MKSYALQAKRSDGKWLCLAGRDYDTLGEAKRDYDELPAEDRAFYRIVKRHAGRLRIVKIMPNGTISFETIAKKENAK